MQEGVISGAIRSRINPARAHVVAGSVVWISLFPFRSGPGLLQLHRHIFPRWGMAAGPGGRTWAADKAGERSGVQDVAPFLRRVADDGTLPAQWQRGPSKAAPFLLVKGQLGVVVGVGEEVPGRMSNPPLQP